MCIAAEVLFFSCHLFDFQNLLCSNQPLFSISSHEIYYLQYFYIAINEFWPFLPIRLSYFYFFFFRYLFISNSIFEFQSKVTKRGSKLLLLCSHLSAILSWNVWQSILYRFLTWASGDAEQVATIFWNLFSRVKMELLMKKCAQYFSKQDRPRNSW